MLKIIPEDIVDAFLFHAGTAAAGAILTEFNSGVFADRRETGIGFSGVDTILLGHTNLRRIKS